MTDKQDEFHKRISPLFDPIHTAYSTAQNTPHFGISINSFVFEDEVEPPTIDEMLQLRKETKALETRALSFGEKGKAALKQVIINLARIDLFILETKAKNQKKKLQELLKEKEA